ncbi:MAG TPA: hypothetical protein VK665_17615, partial [Candidatus Elarobacter sp.]|nr:hypothetical protein [Candidatus Elarobacter sp.]
MPPFERPPKPERSKALRLHALFAVLAVGVIAGCAGGGGGSVTPQGATTTHGHARNGMNISRALPAASPTPVPAEQAGCGPGPANGASCGVKKNGNVKASNKPVAGLTAAQLRAAYGLPPAASTGTPAGPLIAIVVAFDSASAEADMGTYRSTFGLPACTTANGCFQKVQLKPVPGAPPPAPAPPSATADATTWSDERALDLAMASAACPTCRIMLVEAVGQDLDSLAQAVSTAASYGPVAISNSWGVPEGGGNVANIDSDAQAAFNQPGIAITASAGDLGAGQVQFPASSPFVTSVGGTSLAADAAASRGWDESVWSGSANGCSIMVALPAWQTSAGGCSGSRSVPDVSFLADTNPGV